MKSIFLKLKAIISWLKWVIKSERTLKKKIKRGGGKIESGVKIRINGNVIVGKNVTINSHGIDSIARSQIFVSNGGTLEFGDKSGMTATSINCTTSIKLGTGVNIGAGCLIMDSDFHSSNWKDRMDWRIDATNKKSAPITIGEYCFIGARSIICKGVNIGEHSTIAAGSVVINDIPANCIAGGNPCKIIKRLE